jgi:hypothetical protein
MHKKDEESYARLPQDWIAVFHYPERGTLDDGCPSVIDRVSVLQSPLIEIQQSSLVVTWHNSLHLFPRNLNPAETYFIQAYKTQFKDN